MEIEWATVLEQQNLLSLSFSDIWESKDSWQTLENAILLKPESKAVDIDEENLD